MTDELLPYYHQELEFIRKMGDEFARTTPRLPAGCAWIGASPRTRMSPG